MSAPAVAIRGSTVSIWSYDFSRKALTPLTAGLSSQFPVWTPDGKRIVYRGTRSGFRNLYWKRVDGSGEEERLTTSANIQGPGSISKASRAFHQTAAFWPTGPLSPAAPKCTCDHSQTRETDAGRFSTDGGNEPVWSRDGRKLFYLQGQKMMSVDITTQPLFKPGLPRLLYEGRFELGFPRGAISGYDISLDAQRFLSLQPPPEEPPSIAVVINWIEELKKLVPPK